MDQRNRRSSDPSTALHLFLESQLDRIDARSLRVTRGTGEIIAAVGNDAYADEWVATSTLFANELVIASSGGRVTDEVGRGVLRITS